MYYVKVKDPYGTGDWGYYEYELINEKREIDSKQVLDYLTECAYDRIPDTLYMDIDGDNGPVSFMIFPMEILTDDDIQFFIKQNEE